ncbi:hypothetical protein KC865_01810 [Candidatus Kaiserbacteria bacterium]|nr:hypothetical protein [Candidatus Kaiserbacteria bacterium]USN91977.1 MAG: hypothetical protein H6782_03825 [Candidatus Nomurabacteria bacterium]
MLKTLLQKIVTYFFLVIVITVVGIVTLSMYATRQAIIKETTNNLGVIANEVSHNVNAILSDGINDARLISENPVILNTNSSGSEKENELLKFKKLLRRYEDITIIDEKGKVISSTDYNYRERWQDNVWYREAINGYYTASNVHVITNPTKFVINFFAPIFSTEGIVIGVVSLQLNMESIWDLTDSVQIGKTGRVIVLDEKERIIADRNKDRILRGTEEHRGHGKHAVDTTFLDSILQSYLISSDSITIENSVVSVGDVEYDNLFSGWTIIAIQDEQEALSLLSTYRRDIFIFSLLILLVTLLISLRFARSITTPIKEFVTFAESAGKGLLDKEMSSATLAEKNEIGDLSRALSKMAHDLEKSQKRIKNYSDDLEKMVTERTNDLESKNLELEKFNKIVIGRELKMIELKNKIKELESGH